MQIPLLAISRTPSGISIRHSGYPDIVNIIFFDLTQIILHFSTNMDNIILLTYVDNFIA